MIRIQSRSPVRAAEAGPPDSAAVRRPYAAEARQSVAFYARRRRLSFGFAVVAGLAALGGAAPALAQEAGSGSAGERVTRLADEYMAGVFELVPELATIYGVPEADHGRLSDNSLAALRAWEAREDAWYERLRGIDAASLAGTPEWVTYGFLREGLESARQSRVCRTELWGVSQMQGWQVLMPRLTEVQPVGSEEAREAALRRFGALPEYIQIEISKLGEGLRQGYSAPRGAVERVLSQIDPMLSGPVEESPFYQLAKRDSTPGFQQDVAALIGSDINPALERFRTFLREDYLPKARMETAVSANPHGDECYLALTRASTSVDLGAREIHEIGLAEMARIDAEMREIAERSFGTTDVPALLERLRSEEFTYDSGEEILAHAKAAVERARAEAPRWFGRLPRTEMVVEPVPPHEAPSVPAAYYLRPSQDGDRPGIYRVNLHEADRQPRAPTESVAFHEAIPGHHLQIALGMERPAAHQLTRFFGSTAFIEGWGLYAERLADEMGLYSGDLDRLGMLSSQALRAGRLVVDTGLHALGWSREQAIGYLLEHTAEGEEPIAVEVDRYIIMPGQATAYMIGRLEIQRLREMAENQLGDHFEIAEFHDLVLADGAVTLPMLREKVERWIQEERRGA